MTPRQLAVRGYSGYRRSSAVVGAGVTLNCEPPHSPLSAARLVRRCLLLFKPKFLVLLQERDGFAQTPLARLLLLSEHDPPDVVPAIGRRQALEILPGLRACHQGQFH